MPFLRQSVAADQQQKDLEPLSTNEVFFIPETGEIFEEYEGFLGAFARKGQPVWSCRSTGKGGLTFWEAQESERRCQELVDSFPELWKAPILRMVQHSFDSPELVATQLTDFCKVHFLQGEYVRIDINADVRYWGEVLCAIHGLRPDGTDSSEYKVSLAAEPNGVVIGEASFVGTPPFFRNKSVPSKMLIKKFIRSVAARNLFPGAPWIVNADLVKQYGLKSELPVHLAEAALKAARAIGKSSEGMATKDSLVSGTTSEPIDEGPKPDEELPGFADPFKVSPRLGATANFDKVLEVWYFLQAFSGLLRISPFSLGDFLAALRHDDLPNPILEAAHNALLTPLSRERKTKGAEVLPSIHGQSAVYEDPEEGDRDMDMDVDPEDEAFSVLDSLVKVKWWDSPAGAWWINLAAFLAHWHDVCGLHRNHWIMSRVLKALEQGYMRPAAKGYLALSTDLRVELLWFLAKLVETLPVTRQHVEGQLERSLEARKDRRQAEIDRNKLAKEMVDLAKELADLEAAIAAGGPSDTKEIRRLEAALRKGQTQEGQLAKRSEASFREERKASAFRVTSLGADRHGRQYWWLDFHLTAPAHIDSLGCNMLLVQSGADWSYYDEPEQVDLLVASLNDKGMREYKLLSHLARSKPLLLETLRPQAGPEAPSEAMPTDVMSDESEEEMIVAPKRRGRRPSAKTAAKRAAEADLPAFLRYRNTLATKK